MSQTMNGEKKALNGYVKTKVGLIPKDWKTIKFSKLLASPNSLAYGILQPGGDVKHGVPMLRTVDLAENGLKVDAELLKVSKSLDDQYKRTRLKGGEVIISVMGTLGRCVLVPDEWAGWNVNRALAVAQINNEIDKRFLLHTFRSPQFERRIIEEALGSAQKRINLNDLKEYLIILPPSLEQTKIADILCCVDEAIDKTQKLINQIRVRNKGLARQLLTGKKRLKRFSGEWRKVKFSDVAERTKRKNDELNDTVVTISAQRGFVLQEQYFSKRVASETLSNYYLIHRGEFAYNKSYSNGYPMGAFKRLDNCEKAVVTTLYICFGLKDDVDSDFMSYFFEAGLLIPDLMEIAQEGGRAHGLLNISLPDFFGMQLKIPSKQEQIEIAKVLSTAIEELKKSETRLLRLKEQKKGLMQKLLTGELRVKVEK